MSADLLPLHRGLPLPGVDGCVISVPGHSHGQLQDGRRPPVLPDAQDAVHDVSGHPGGAERRPPLLPAHRQERLL